MARRCDGFFCRPGQNVGRAIERYLPGSLICAHIVCGQSGRGEDSKAGIHEKSSVILSSFQFGFRFAFVKEICPIHPRSLVAHWDWAWRDILGKLRLPVCDRRPDTEMGAPDYTSVPSHPPHSPLATFLTPSEPLHTSSHSCGRCSDIGGSTGVGAMFAQPSSNTPMT